jgi:hypothetical protein
VARWNSVFVSHGSDMAGYPPGRSFVQAAIDAVLKAGLRPVDMRYFAAREGQPAEYCQSQVRKCDIYLAVVGFRYGSRVPDRTDGASYTELEFLVATEAGMPRLVFVLDEKVRLPRRLVDRDRSAVDLFRRRLQQAGVITKSVTTPAELSEAVLHALYEMRLAQLQDSGGTDAADGRRRPWMAPPLDQMVERSELGERLVAALVTPDVAEVGLTTGLHGVGGFGKTTLATWACHRPEVDMRYPGGLLWVTIGREVRGADLAERVNDLAFVLSGQRPAISDPDVAGAELGRLLDERKSVLLVVDDVWEESQLRPFRYGGSSCTRLVTTRVPDLLPAGGEQIPVDAMSAEQARQLICDRLRGLPLSMADRLASVAGRWPVLLSLINGVLRRRLARGQSPSQAAEEILGLLTMHGPAALDPARPTDRARAVAATMNASLTLLNSVDRQRYLDLAIFPEDVGIPLNVLTLLWPNCRVDALCEELVAVGLVTDYRLDPPGPRLVLHDVIRAHLRSLRSAADQRGAHRRLVGTAAAKLLPDPGNAGATPWWMLPADAGYLWRFLPHHLHEAAMSTELAALVCDARWVEAKTKRFGSVVGVEADLALVSTPTADTLRRTLRQAGPLLGPIDPPTALGATLASRLADVPGLEVTLNSYRATLPRPRLEPAWPLPDQLDSTSPATLDGHTGGVTSCAFSPNGSLLATTSDDKTVLLWQMPGATCQRVLVGHTGGVWGCAFSPDGSLLATTSDDKTVRLWQISDATCQAVLYGHTGWVQHCSFSADGALLATAGNDGTIRLWRLTDGSCRAVLTGHTGRVTGCAFSPDGTLIAGTGDDGTVRLWQISDGTSYKVLSGHTDPAWGLRVLAQRCSARDYEHGPDSSPVGDA